MIDKVKVLDGGQIVIPEFILSELDIAGGDELLVTNKNGKIVLGKEDSFEDWNYFINYSLQELWDNDEDEKWTKELIKANNLSIKER